MDETSQDAGPSSFRTPQTDQLEWSSSASVSTPSSSTPSRQTLPRRLSLLQNDTSSPVRSQDAHRTSFTGPKPLSLGSQSVTTASASAAASDTPRRGKRTSLTYIPSPSTTVKAEDVQLSRVPSTSSASGKTRTGSISRAADSRRTPSQASQGANSDADDWLVSEEDSSFSINSATRSMAERDSAKVEALFNDTGYREGITAGKLSTLQTGFDQGFNENGPGSRRSASLGSVADSGAQDLLRLIAEKERRCFELREELASEEAQLKQLRSTWQRTATREFAYSSSPSTAFHRRDASTTSITSDTASEAWTSFSSKLPGSLKTQLNNLLESIANMDQPLEPIEKQSPLSAKNSLHAPSGDGSMLRPVGTNVAGGGLSVLEEEGSDVGSVALSPRSPRSPAVPEPNPSPHVPRETLQSHEKLASLAVTDSQALGFSVDSNGIATRTPSNSRVLIESDENPPPTPAKPEPIQPRTSLWTSHRASMLGSLANLQSKLQTPEKTDSQGGFASMLSKRFKEARENASDLLREAERKLGNAMTIDDLLGINPTSTSSSHQDRPKSPQIKLDEASADSSYNASTWFEAAGGRRSSESSQRRQVRSPSLQPVASEAEGGRLSISSSSSSSSLALPRVGSPHASPPVGGLPGSAGVFGMLMGSQTDLHAGSDARSRRGSGESWGWGANDATDDWDDTADTAYPDRRSLVSIGLDEPTNTNTPRVDEHI